MPTKSLVHLNNHLLCAIDVETTGLRPGFHEIIQIAIIPLDNWLQPRKDLPIFEQRMCPKRLDRVDFEALEVSQTQFDQLINGGIDPEKALELFEYWFKRLNLPENKRLVPLGFNVTLFDLPFIYDWMGHTMYHQYIHGYARDVMTVCHYLNDVADRHCEQVEFNKMKLRQVARHAGVEVFNEILHDALIDAYLAAQVYEKLLSYHLLNVL